MDNGGKLVVISGPSGVGKSTISKEVLRRTGAEFSVSVTTRKPRPGEVAGRDYLFVELSEFERMIKQGELLEWAEVFGNMYGTPAGPVSLAIEAGRTRRLGKARDELATARQSGAYGHIVINDDLEAAMSQVVEIVQGHGPNQIKTGATND